MRFSRYARQLIPSTSFTTNLLRIARHERQSFPLRSGLDWLQGIELPLRSGRSRSRRRSPTTSRRRFDPAARTPNGVAPMRCGSSISGAARSRQGAIGLRGFAGRQNLRRLLGSDIESVKGVIGGRRRKQNINLEEVHLRALRFGGQADEGWLANRSSLACQASEGWRAVWDEFRNFLLEAA
jgi:hypothetical protein